MTDDVRYPIGKFQPPATITPEDVAKAVDEIAAFPAQLQSAVNFLNEQQLDTPYRPDGWTVRQVIHHLADSHLNSYVRFRLALTEDRPTIKPYNEGSWAELQDARLAPIELSLDLLDRLHQRWILVLRSLRPEDWAKEFKHPERDRMLRLDWNALLYAWHGKHHLAHITRLADRMGWGSVPSAHL